MATKPANSSQMAPPGFVHSSDSKQETPVSKIGGAESGALGGESGAKTLPAADALATWLAACPVGLPEAIRAAVAGLVGSVTGGGPPGPSRGLSASAGSLPVRGQGPFLYSCDHHLKRSLTSQKDITQVVMN